MKILMFTLAMSFMASSAFAAICRVEMQTRRGRMIDNFSVSGGNIEQACRRAWRRCERALQRRQNNGRNPNASCVEANRSGGGNSGGGHHGGGGYDSSNSCSYANDGTCDDGRPGSSYSICEYGTDENDCSGVYDDGGYDDGGYDDGGYTGGSNSCRYANDGACDDGRPGAAYSLCEYGTDENDCSGSYDDGGGYDDSGSNSCSYAYDGACDDGRPGAAYSICEYGTDESDCAGIGGYSMIQPLLNAAPALKLAIANI